MRQECFETGIKQDRIAVLRIKSGEADVTVRTADSRMGHGKMKQDNGL